MYLFFKSTIICYYCCQINLHELTLHAFTYNMTFTFFSDESCTVTQGMCIKGLILYNFLEFYFRCWCPRFDISTKKTSQYICTAFFSGALLKTVSLFDMFLRCCCSAWHRSDAVWGFGKRTVGGARDGDWSWWLSSSGVTFLRKSQWLVKRHMLLYAGCVHFTVDWLFWNLNGSYIAP